MYTQRKTDKEIKAMRRAGRICAQILELLCSSASPSMSTQDLAQIAEFEIKKAGAKPSFLGYNGFPSVICISLNDEIVHGIPSKKRQIVDGDIISFDLGVTYDGMIVDSAKTVIIGDTGSKVKELLKFTNQSLSAGLNQVKANCRTGDIAAAVEAVLSSKGYGIIRDLVGHGVGHQVHEEPNIPNFGHKGTGAILKKGMTVAVEPMATLGGHEIFIDKDGWTVKSKDKSLSAHFEHTILVNEDGCEILTTL